MKGDNTDTYIVSPACQEVTNKSVTSYDDLPIWAILEMVQTRLLNASENNTAEMIAAVRARLSKLTNEDTAQYNPVQTKSDWKAQLDLVKPL